LERARERQYERNRRRAIEDYNQATFGQRRPFAGPFLRLFEVSAVCTACVLVLPSPMDFWAMLASLVIFRIWEFRRFHP
jgi:hypothetical protein